MSRYATRAELVDQIRTTVETDHLDLGFPPFVQCYNFAAIIREVQIIGTRTYGYTMRVTPEEFKAIVSRNLRSSYSHYRTERWNPSPPVANLIVL